MPRVSDELLGWAIRWLPVARRQLARRAAGRALHAAALWGAPHDPVVLARLGLFADEPELAPGVDARRAVAIMQAGREGAVPAGAPAWPAEWRRRVAAALAPHNPAEAAALLPDASLASAASRLAAGELPDPPARDTPEGSLLAAAIEARGGRPHAAADAINQAFAACGLASPLASRGEQLALDSYAGEIGSRQEGPLISAIVPMHNDGATIATAVRSLQRQSWRNLEIVVCDDRSMDEGPRIVASLAAGDSRIRLVASTGAPGASGTRNHAMSVSRGGLFAFLDADDWAHPARIARQMIRLDRAAAATVSAHYRVDAGGCPVAPRVFPMLRLCPISMLVRRAVLEEAGPFALSRAGADAELLGRLDTLYGRRAVPRERAPLTVARWRPNSISSDPARGLFDAERFRYRSSWMREHAAMFGAGGLPRPLPPS